MHFVLAVCCDAFIFHLGRSLIPLSLPLSPAESRPRAARCSLAGSCQQTKEEERKEGQRQEEERQQTEQRQARRR